MIMFGGVVFSMWLLVEECWMGIDVLFFILSICEGEVVLGKYFLVLIFLIVLILMLFYLFVLIFVNGKVSWGYIGVGYFGMILFGASMLVVGIFVFVLIKNLFLVVFLSGFFVGLLEFCWLFG